MPRPPGERPAPRTAGEVLARSREFLAAKGVEAARREAELLVAEALGLDRLGLYLALERPVDATELGRARELVVRRAKGEPAAHLLGRREFYGRRFTITRDVLVPRPETELLVDRAREVLAALAEGAPEDPDPGDLRLGPRVADLGTGSGCIAVTLALEVPAARVLAVDLSAEALAVARANGEALGADPARLAFVLGEGLEALLAAAPFELVVSNPPYIERGDPALEASVRDHEPELALYAPAGDPDHFARRLLEERARLLVPGGTALVELGHDQAPRLEALARDLGVAVRFHDDLEGVPRLLEFSR